MIGVLIENPDFGPIDPYKVLGRKNLASNLENRGVICWTYSFESTSGPAYIKALVEDDFDMESIVDIGEVTIFDPKDW